MEKSRQQSCIVIVRLLRMSGTKPEFQSAKVVPIAHFPYYKTGFRDDRYPVSIHSYMRFVSNGEINICYEVRLHDFCFSSVLSAYELL
jgi:hypothetical protein